MNTIDFIRNCEKEKIIGTRAAEQMVQAYKKENNREGTSRFMTAFATIGVSLLGLALISFIASNWQFMPSGVKIIMSLLAVMGAAVGGYVLAEIKKIYVRLGRAMLFFSCVGVGGLLGLLSQVYHLNGELYTLLAVWGLAVLPIAYLLAMKGIAVLSVALLFASGVLWLINIFNDSVVTVALLSMPSLLFSIGCVHTLLPKKYWFPKRLYRLTALCIGLLCYYFLSFKEIMREILFELHENTLVVAAVCAVFIAGALLSAYYARTKEQQVVPMLAAGGALLALPLITLLPIAAVLVGTIFVNIILFAGLLALLYFGYTKHDGTLTSVAGLGVIVYVISKYFSWFHEILAVELLYGFLGLGLVAAAIMLEKKREKLMQHFSSQHD